jgi:hypothetical protein
MTLLEVLTALAIFLMAMVVFGGIFVRNGQVALDIQRKNLATRLCQSKMAEVASGLVPLSSDSGEPFDDEPSYTWSVDAQQGSVDGLWNVTVTVTGPPTSDGEPVQCALMQMVLDPSVVGSTQDVTPVTTSSSSSSGTGSSSSTSSSTPAATGAATPSTTPTTPSTAGTTKPGGK